MSSFVLSFCFYCYFPSSLRLEQNTATQQPASLFSMIRTVWRGSALIRTSSTSIPLPPFRFDTLLDFLSFRSWYRIMWKRWLDGNHVRNDFGSDCNGTYFLLSLSPSFLSSQNQCNSDCNKSEENEEKISKKKQEGEVCNEVRNCFSSTFSPPSPREWIDSFPPFSCFWSRFHFFPTYLKVWFLSHNWELGKGILEWNVIYKWKSERLTLILVLFCSEILFTRIILDQTKSERAFLSNGFQNEENEMFSFSFHQESRGGERVNCFFWWIWLLSPSFPH